MKGPAAQQPRLYRLPTRMMSPPRRPVTRSPLLPNPLPGPAKTAVGNSQLSETAEKARAAIRRITSLLESVRSISVFDVREREALTPDFGSHSYHFCAPARCRFNTIRPLLLFSEQIR